MNEAPPESAPPQAPQTEEKSTPDSAWTNPKLLHMASLSLAGAVPLTVILNTLPAYLADLGIRAKDIGLFALAGLPWSFKFIWSPIIDRYTLPFGGRRRGWIILAQLMLLFSVALVPWVDSRTSAIIAVGFAIAFFSATQDIAMDAYAVELMSKSQQGPGNALRTTFYRIGMLAAGGAAIALADQVAWSVVFALIGLVMLPSALLTWTAPEPVESQGTEDRGEPPSLADAVYKPIVEFFKRKYAIPILAFVFIYKFGDNMAASLLAHFFIHDLQVSKTEFGFAQKTVGMASTIIGVLLGGAMLPRLGLGRALVGFGFAQALANVTYALTAYTDGFRPIMYTALALENGCGGMGTAALLTLITRLCKRGMAATQFALLSSLFGLGRTLSGPPSGYLSELLGYGPFFIVTAIAAAPGLLILWWFPFWKESALQDS